MKPTRFLDSLSCSLFTEGCVLPTFQKECPPPLPSWLTVDTISDLKAVQASCHEPSRLSRDDPDVRENRVEIAGADWSAAAWPTHFVCELWLWRLRQGSCIRKHAPRRSQPRRRSQRRLWRRTAEVSGHPWSAGLKIWSCPGAPQTPRRFLISVM